MGEASSGGSKLEGPEEVVSSLEMGADCVNLVDQILNRSYSGGLAQSLGNNLVVRKWDSLLIYFSVSSLVYESFNGVP